MIPFYPEGHRLSDDDPTYFVCRYGHPWKEIKAPNRDVAVSLFMEQCHMQLLSLQDDEWFFVHQKGSPMMEKVRAYPVIHTLSHEMWFEGEWRATFAKQYGEVPT